MLWYKSWLKTRPRFFVGAGAMAALCAFYFFYRATAVVRLSEMLRLHPNWHRPWWIHRVINEYPFYIWRILFNDSLHFLWGTFAVLIGVGGLTQESIGEAAQITLSLPLSSRQLGWTRAAVCCMELIGLGLIIISTAVMVSLASLTGPYENELKEPVVFRAIDLFRLISGPPDLNWRTFPWLGLLVSLALALLLAWFAARAIDNRDYW